KPVLARLDDQPLLHGELLDTLRWTAGYYHAPLGAVLATALPGLLRAGQPLPDPRRAAWRATAAGREAGAAPGRPGRPLELLQLLGAQALDEDTLDRQLPGWRPAARSLAARGLAEPVLLEPAPAAPAPVGDAPVPT